jgi:hypothetical protein
VVREMNRLKARDLYQKLANKTRAAPRLVSRSSAERNYKLHAAANHYLQCCMQPDNWMLAFDVKAGQLRSWGDDWIVTCRHLDSVQANMPNNGASSPLLVRVGVR